MRIPLALPRLFLIALALPTALPAQIVPKTEPTAPPGQCPDRASAFGRL